MDFICEHDNLIEPRLQKAFFSMPAKFYATVARTLDAHDHASECAFVLYRDQLEARATEMEKKRS